MLYKRIIEPVTVPEGHYHIKKCCFVAVEFVDEEDQYLTVVRYTKKGNPGTVKKTEHEAADFDAYILEGKFRKSIVT